MSNISEDTITALTEALISTLEDRYSTNSESEKGRVLFLKAHMQALIEYYQYGAHAMDFKVSEKENTYLNAAAHNFLTSYPFYAPLALLAFFSSKIQTLKQYQNLRQEWPELAVINSQEELDQLVNQLNTTAALLKVLLNFRGSLNESDLGSFIPVMGLVGALVGVLIFSSLAGAGLIVGCLVGLAIGFLIMSQLSRYEENQLYDQLKAEIQPKLQEVNLLDLKSREPLSEDFFQRGLADILQNNLEHMAPNLKL